jgi:hypothetical protein
MKKIFFACMSITILIFSLGKANAQKPSSELLTPTNHALVWKARWGLQLRTLPWMN